MPRRSIDTQGTFLSKTPTPSSNQPSLFFSDCQLPYLTIGELEDPLCEQLEIFEEPIRQEEKAISPTQIMVENMENEVFPIKETNGDDRMKNIIHIALPHFHGLTSEDPDTFIFELFVFCRTYDYAFDDHKLNFFPSTLKDATLHWFMGLPRGRITTWVQMQQAFKNKYRDCCRSKETKEEILECLLDLMNP